MCAPMARCRTAPNTAQSPPGSPTRRAATAPSIKTGSEVSADSIDAVLADVRPDHVVVATGARYRRDGFQGQSAQPLPGWESGRCVTWDEIALDKVTASGNVLVIDEMADVAAPLTAVKLAQLGAHVKLLTKWPMIGWETTAEVYLHWVLTYLYEADVEIITDHAVKRISGAAVEAANLYAPAKTRRLVADTIVMATARASENALYHLLGARGRSVEAIGCAVAPRTVYEATLEGHRAARKLGAPSPSRMAMEALKNQALS